MSLPSASEYFYFLGEQYKCPIYSDKLTPGASALNVVENDVADDYDYTLRIPFVHIRLVLIKMAMIGNLGINSANQIIFSVATRHAKDLQILQVQTFFK